MLSTAEVAGGAENLISREACRPTGGVARVRVDASFAMELSILTGGGFDLDLLRCAIQAGDAEAGDLACPEFLRLRGLSGWTALPPCLQHRAQRCKIGRWTGLIDNGAWLFRRGRRDVGCCPDAFPQFYLG